MSFLLRCRLEVERRRRAADTDPVARLYQDRLFEWREDPFLWARERLGLPLKRWADYDPERYATHQWDGTPEPLWSVGQALGRWQSCAVDSATGIGKTYLGGILLPWFLDCFEPIIDPVSGEELHQGGQVITVAPKEDQLKLNLWKEVTRVWPRFQRIRPQARLDTLRIRMRPGRDDWGAIGFVAGVGAVEEVANRARGFHNEHLLILFEETTGIHRAILEAFGLTCTAPHNLRLFFGNRDGPDDQLGDAGREPNVVTVRASAYDHPNIVCNDPSLVPGASSVVKLEEWKIKYGERDRMFLSRARGIAPTQAADSLILREWLEAAAARYESSEWVAFLEGRGAFALGVDVANSDGGDEAALAYGMGQYCRTVETFPCPDANAFARQRVVPLITSGLVMADRVGIDNVGVGAGSVNECKRLRHAVIGLNGGEAEWPDRDSDEQFFNLRAQMWWQARLDLQRPHSDKFAIALPRQESLWQDLMAPKWFTRNGKIVVESKEDFKKRLGRSPDEGDAFVYWNWIRQRTNQPLISQATFRFG